MSLKKTIDRSWQILDFKEKQKLVVAIFFQSLLNFLDLVGVIFLSFTTYILANNKIPSFRQLEFLNSIDQNRIAFACVK